ncbi:MAG: NAD(P)/FAD-dependent oxidoreductase [Bacteroidota bacterium]|nr:NAD(P)/FAD-dependent oxidoreductase [Bacteroidota bacterium]
MDSYYDIAIIGGGAAGFFGAIAAAETGAKDIVIIEKQHKFLRKVSVSGGGRCNVTHNQADTSVFVKAYPRGEKELKQVYARWGQQETIQWFAKHGVELKTEADGRMFPVTNDSQTIINCLMDEAEKQHIKLMDSVSVEHISYDNNQYILKTNRGTITCKKLLIACGGFHQSNYYNFIRELGHTIIEPVPSLFTFNIEDKNLRSLSGISVPNGRVKIAGIKKGWEGPLLITHRGLSGPVILKASAWAASELHQYNYRFDITINWGWAANEQVAMERLQSEYKTQKKKVGNTSFGTLPQRLLYYIFEQAEINTDMLWADVPKASLYKLATLLTTQQLTVTGKSTNKDEFVTAGGVALNEVNMQTMESKLHPNLYFAGEILNIDGITGGFNFQAAWSTGRLAGEGMR